MGKKKLTQVYPGYEEVYIYTSQLYMKTETISKIFIYYFLLLASTACNSQNKESVINNFFSDITESDKIIIRFTDNGFNRTTPLVKVIYKTAVVAEFKELLRQSNQESHCSYINGTIAFFKGSAKKGYLEFSNNPDCPALYLHHSGRITQYKMSAFFSMFLESVKQGEK